MSPERFGKWLAIKVFRTIRKIPGEDGISEYQADEVRDPQTTRRTIADDNFNFERWR